MSSTSPRPISEYAPVDGCDCKVCHWLRNRKPYARLRPGTPEWDQMVLPRVPRPQQPQG
jgi:hypothetical protein